MTNVANVGMYGAETQCIIRTDAADNAVGLQEGVNAMICLYVQDTTANSKFNCLNIHV